ncbi:MAG: hypothetical protein JO317_08215, partial [Verrucomicrobiae bacterium]|nr:hypothetical protein [Verrucomicrobiae bacterium]
DPSYFHTGVTLAQSLSEHLSIALTYEYDENPWKPTHTGRDETGPHYLGVTTSYRF